MAVTIVTLLSWLLAIIFHITPIIQPLQKEWYLIFPKILSQWFVISTKMLLGKPPHTSVSLKKSKTNPIFHSSVSQLGPQTAD